MEAMPLPLRALSLSITSAIRDVPRKKKKNYQNQGLFHRCGMRLNRDVIWVSVTSEIETFRRRERDLHEMRVLQLPISAKVVNHRHLAILLVLGRLLGPDFGPLRTHLPVLFHPCLHSPHRLDKKIATPFSPNIFKSFLGKVPAVRPNFSESTRGGCQMSTYTRTKWDQK